MSSGDKILPHYTYDDFCQWEGRWEIIEGIPYAMAPAPAPRHQLISNKIKYEITDAIKKKGCKKCEFYDFIDIKISDDTIVEPDAVVCCGEIIKPFLDFAPAIIAEILSPSTAMKDRNNKFYQYQLFKIPYYLIIDADKNTIEVYLLDSTGTYQLEKINPGEPYTFLLDDGCTIEVVLDAIWS
jgi:Uma2 family endonuclease